MIGQTPPEEDKQSFPAENYPAAPAKSRSRSRSADRFKRKPKFPFNPRRDGKRIFKPGLAGGLLSFKQFMELQQDALDPFEAQQYYDEYKARYERKHIEIFFNEHCEEHWFIEKYDPSVSQQWQDERFLNAKVLHRAFVESARNNVFAGLLLRETGETVEKLSGPPYNGFDPNSMTLFLKTIPVHISRWDILNLVKTSPGFVSLSMSEPLKSQAFSRFAWVLYDTEEHCNESLELLNNKTVTPDFKLSPVRSQSSSRKDIQVAPMQAPECLETDWKQSARLIICLDREKGINENPLLIKEENFKVANETEQELQLDLQILYLRRVHAFCYYCLEEYEDERMLSAKCGPAHIKGRYDPSATRAKDFDTNIEVRLNRVSSIPKYDRESDKELQDMMTAFEKENILEEEEKKVRCELCKKLFRGMEFIRKHLHTKHPEDVDRVVNKRMKAILLENYISDPDKITNQISIAGEGMRGHDRRRFIVKKKSTEGPYEDLDDPYNNIRSKRKIIDYSDL